ncbi:ORF6C domain-containing protein [Enterococcus gallinarum]|uniref:ORF6C domain-containing protein n=1 Tax=Enterococcus gallinarum TaxID=1353 RepID=A0AAE4KY66_ENTGA|nr:ORF6C domain-containing protein [Enterococcus gallinarum]MDT2690742.1 ORF6C domain-containing protein [Enterococcus gallinarum]
MGLIPIIVNENNEQLVSGRELYEFLEVATPYTQWFERMVEYGFTENVDFIGLSQKSEKPQGGRPMLDHAISLDMAKEISMIQRTEKGKQARQYFIQVEKEYRKELKKTLNDPREQLRLFYQFGEQTAVRVDAIEKDVSILKETMRISGKQEADIQRAGKQKVIEVLGGKDSPAYESISKKVFATFWSEFKRYFSIPRYGELPCKQFEEALIFIAEWLPETAMRMEINQLNRQSQLFRA